jgi:hypothetical protein
LDPAVSSAVPEILERKVAGFDLEQRVADAEGDLGQGGEVGGGGEDPALLAGALGGAGDGEVDCFAEGIGDEAEGCAGVGYGFVS